MTATFNVTHFGKPATSVVMIPEAYDALVAERDQATERADATELDLKIARAEHRRDVRTLERVKRARDRAREQRDIAQGERDDALERCSRALERYESAQKATVNERVRRDHWRTVAYKENERAATLTAERDAAVAANAPLVEQIEQALANNDAMNAARARAWGDLARADAALDVLRDELADLNRRHDAATARNRDLMAQRDGLRISANEWQNEAERLRAQVRELEARPLKFDVKAFTLDDTAFDTLGTRRHKSTWAPVHEVDEHGTVNEVKPSPLATASYRSTPAFAMGGALLREDDLRIAFGFDGADLNAPAPSHEALPWPVENPFEVGQRVRVVYACCDDLEEGSEHKVAATMSETMFGETRHYLYLGDEGSGGWDVRRFEAIPDPEPMGLQRAAVMLSTWAGHPYSPARVATVPLLREGALARALARAEKVGLGRTVERLRQAYAELVAADLEVVA